MFWEIEEIKQETKVIPLKVIDNSFPKFSEWEKVVKDYFIFSYTNRIQEIMVRISKQIIYYDETKDFVILKKPNKTISEDFAFIYGNLIFIRSKHEFTDFFIIHDGNFIRPYGYKIYLFAILCFLNSSIVDMIDYFKFNNLTLKNYEKYNSDNIIFNCIEDYTFKELKLSFSFNEFDFEDLDNPSKIVKFKFE